MTLFSKFRGDVPVQNEQMHHCLMSLSPHGSYLCPFGLLNSNNKEYMDHLYLLVGWKVLLFYCDVIFVDIDEI